MNEKMMSLNKEMLMLRVCSHSFRWNRYIDRYSILKFMNWFDLNLRTKIILYFIKLSAPAGHCIKKKKFKFFF